MHYNPHELAYWWILYDPSDPSEDDDDRIHGYERFSAEKAFSLNEQLRREGSDLRWIKDPAGP